MRRPPWDDALDAAVGCAYFALVGAALALLLVFLPVLAMRFST